jgi:hypothetical protein
MAFNPEQNHMERELTLRIILERPPAGVDFGLQQGSGANYETVQKQRSGDKDLRFEFTVRVKEARDGSPNFLGPFVQGPASARFVYLDIGTYAGQKNTCWSRRLRIPLQGITWNMLTSSVVIETRVPGTGRDRGPNCGTVKPFHGWKTATLRN